MSQQDELAASIAHTISDYRAGEMPTPTPQHAIRWIEQFDVAARVPILAELDHVLKQTYLSKTSVERFLSTIAKHPKLAGTDPPSFWRNVKFLDIQAGGNSQREMLQLLDPILKKECGLQIAECGDQPTVYVYLDDAIFTGNRVRADISAWIIDNAPQQAKMHVVTMALHSGGQYYASRKIQEAAREAGKKIDITWWRAVEIEDRKANVNSSDVLRPTSIPNDEAVKEYAAALAYPVVLRKPGNVGGKKFFSTEEGRNLLEQEFLKAGVKIRKICPHLNKYQRPLGNMLLETLGFGSLLVTFRNCPNNAPLALWAGDPWYPLFPRKIN